MKIIIKSKIFDKDKYAFYDIKKDFGIKTSKGDFDIKKGEIMGIRRATSNKNQVRLIDYNDQNKVVSIPLANLFELKPYVKYRKDSKQEDIFND